MKKTILSLLVCLSAMAASAQWTWHNPVQVGFPVIQNQGFTPEIGNTYTRLPQRAQGIVRDAVWNLSQNSAGLAIHFYSNAPEIKVRYTVSGGHSMPHMPATGVSGIDMYSIDSNGDSNFCFGGYSFGDTIHYHYSSLGKDQFHDRGFEYRIYLPLYNSVKWMEIGVPASSEISFIPVSNEKPIVLYGTSIAQGACASRPGMAWSSIVQRSVGYPLINFGFSGNGKLEKEMLDLVNEPDARLFILDCLPNLTPNTAEEVTAKVIAAVQQLRAKHDAPILLVEHAGYSNAPTNQIQYDQYTRANKASRKAYEKLLDEQVKALYYLSHDELNLLPDAWVDWVHPSDLGMQQQAAAVEKKIREILRIPVGTLSTTQPVTQRREPHNYEWQTRHRSILDYVQTESPKAVILGNSITHFWGGEPAGPYANGPETWKKRMQPAGFINLGYGWDRIENVLWRVYHGELDGYSAEKIVLMIGTNNMGMNSDEEIVEGLRFLLAAIRERQPRAILKVIGVLPRRDGEQWVKTINHSISQMAKESGCLFANPGVVLLGKDGKIDEKFFLDGLHPNEKGYAKIGKSIAE